MDIKISNETINGHWAAIYCACGAALFPEEECKQLRARLTHRAAALDAGPEDVCG